MNLQILKDSPLELPTGCRDAMEEQARQIFQQEDREMASASEGHSPKQPRHMEDSPKGTPLPEIPVSVKTSTANPIPEEIPYIPRTGGGI